MQTATIISDCSIIRLGLVTAIESTGHWHTTQVPAAQRTTVPSRANDASIIVLDLETTPVRTSEVICAEARCEIVPLCVLGVYFGHRSLRHLRRLLDVGLTAHIWLGSDMTSLLPTMRAVLGGETIVQVEPEQSRRGSARSFLSAIEKPTVSDIDADILAVMGTGLVDRKVGAQVGMSADTVRRHVEKLAASHGLKTRYQLGIWADQWGLATLLDEVNDT